MDELTPSKQFYFVTVSEDDHLSESKENIKTELESEENIKTELESEENIKTELEPKKTKDQLKKLFKMAKEALQAGQFQSIRACAMHFQISYTTLRKCFETIENMLDQEISRQSSLLQRKQRSQSL